MKINDIKKLLNTLDKDTLIEIICAAAENDSEYGSELALKYGQQDADILDLCADRIRASLTLDIYQIHMTLLRFTMPILTLRLRLRP